MPNKSASVKSSGSRQKSGKTQKPLASAKLPASAGQPTNQPTTELPAKEPTGPPPVLFNGSPLIAPPPDLGATQHKSESASSSDGSSIMPISESEGESDIYREVYTDVDTESAPPSQFNNSQTSKTSDIPPSITTHRVIKPPPSTASTDNPPGRNRDGAFDTIKWGSDPILNKYKEAYIGRIPPLEEIKSGTPVPPPSHTTEIPGEEKMIATGQYNYEYYLAHLPDIPWPKEDIPVPLDASDLEDLPIDNLGAPAYIQIPGASFLSYADMDEAYTNNTKVHYTMRLDMPFTPGQARVKLAKLASIGLTATQVFWSLRRELYRNPCLNLNTAFNLEVHFYRLIARSSGVISPTKPAKLPIIGLLKNKEDEFSPVVAGPDYTPITPVGVSREAFQKLYAEVVRNLHPFAQDLKYEAPTGLVLPASAQDIAEMKEAFNLNQTHKGIIRYVVRHAVCSRAAPECFLGLMDVNDVEKVSTFVTAYLNTMEPAKDFQSVSDPITKVIVSKLATQHWSNLGEIAPGDDGHFRFALYHISSEDNSSEFRPGTTILDQFKNAVAGIDLGVHTVEVIASLVNIGSNLYLLGATDWTTVTGGMKVAMLASFTSSIVLSSITLARACGILLQNNTDELISTFIKSKFESNRGPVLQAAGAPVNLFTGLLKLICLVMAATGFKEFTDKLKDVAATIRAADTIFKETGDLYTGIVDWLFGKEDETLNTMVQPLLDATARLSGQPTGSFLKQIHCNHVLKQMKDNQDMLVQLSNIQRLGGDRGEAAKLVHGLLLSYNAKLHQRYMEATAAGMLSSSIRPEPVVINIHGPGGHGKTHWVRNSLIPYLQKTYALTGGVLDGSALNGNFFPPIGDQDIFFIDEFLGNGGADKWLEVWNTLCSQANITLEGASIDNKHNNPIPRFVITISNINPATARIPGLKLNEGALWSLRSRMASYRFTNAKHDPHVLVRGTQLAYEPHLESTPMSLDGNTEGEVYPITMEEFYTEINASFLQKDAVYQKSLQRAAEEAKVSVQSAEVSGKQGLMLSFYGATGQGKSYMAARVAKNMARVMSVPIIRDMMPRPGPAVYLLDDCILEHEQDFARLTDSCHPRSVIISTLNIAPHFTRKLVNWLPFSGTETARVLGVDGTYYITDPRIKMPGTYRRLGFGYPHYCEGSQTYNNFTGDNLAFHVDSRIAYVVTPEGKLTMSEEEIYHRIAVKFSDMISIDPSIKECPSLPTMDKWNIDICLADIPTVTSALGYFTCPNEQNYIKITDMDLSRVSNIFKGFPEGPSGNPADDVAVCKRALTYVAQTNPGVTIRLQIAKVKFRAAVTDTGVYLVDGASAPTSVIARTIGSHIQVQVLKHAGVYFTVTHEYTADFPTVHNILNSGFFAHANVPIPHLYRPEAIKAIQEEIASLDHPYHVWGRGTLLDRAKLMWAKGTEVLKKEFEEWSTTTKFAIVVGGIVAIGGVLAYIFSSKKEDKPSGKRSAREHAENQYERLQAFLTGPNSKYAQNASVVVEEEDVVITLHHGTVITVPLCRACYRYGHTSEDCHKFDSLYAEIEKAELQNRKAKRNRNKNMGLAGSGKDGQVSDPDDNQDTMEIYERSRFVDGHRIKAGDKDPGGRTYTVDPDLFRRYPGDYALMRAYQGFRPLSNQSCQSIRTLGLHSKPKDVNFDVVKNNVAKASCLVTSESSSARGMYIGGKYVLCNLHLFINKSVTCLVRDDSYTQGYKAKMVVSMRERDFCLVEIDDPAFKILKPSLIKNFVNYGDLANIHDVRLFLCEGETDTILGGYSKFSSRLLPGSCSVDYDGLDVKQRPIAPALSIFWSQIGDIPTRDGDCGSAYLAAHPFLSNRRIVAIHCLAQFDEKVTKGAVVTQEDLMQMMEFDSSAKPFSVQSAQVGDTIQLPNFHYYDHPFNRELAFIVDTETKKMVDEAVPEGKYDIPDTGRFVQLGWNKAAWRNPYPPKDHVRSPFHKAVPMIPDETKPAPNCLEDMDPKNYHLLPTKNGKPSMLGAQLAHMSFEPFEMDPVALQAVRDFIYDLMYEKFVPNYKILNEFEILNGVRGLDNPLLGTVGKVDITKSAGWYGSMVLKRPSKGGYIERVSKDGSDFLQWKNDAPSVRMRERYRLMDQQARKGVCMVDTIEDRAKGELLNGEKVDVGKLRAYENVGLAASLFHKKYMGAIMGAACKTRIRDGSFYTIGCDYAKEFGLLYDELKAVSDVGMDMDFSRYDKRIPYQVAELWHELLADWVIASQPKNYTPEEIRNVFKVILAQNSQELHVAEGAFFHTNGSLNSGDQGTNVNGGGYNAIMFYYCMLKAHENNGRPFYPGEPDKGSRTYADTLQRLHKLTRFFVNGDDNFSAQHRSIVGWCSFQNLQAEYAKFGVIADLPTKDGGVAPPFKLIEDLSFSSRFFIMENGVCLGALKKSSIYRRFHWTTCKTPVHLEDILNGVLMEAVLWGKDFYEEIAAAVRACKSYYNRFYKKELRVPVLPFKTRLDNYLAYGPCEWDQYYDLNTDSKTYDSFPAEDQFQSVCDYIPPSTQVMNPTDKVYCIICGLCQSNFRKHALHVYNSHPSVEKIHCGAPFCDFEGDRPSFKAHKCEFVGRVRCVDCDEDFADYRAASNHHRHQHGGLATPLAEYLSKVHPALVGDTGARIARPLAANEPGRRECREDGLGDPRPPAPTDESVWRKYYLFSPRTLATTLWNPDTKMLVGKMTGEKSRYQVRFQFDPETNTLFINEQDIPNILIELTVSGVGRPLMESAYYIACNEGLEKYSSPDSNRAVGRFMLPGDNYIVLGYDEDMGHIYLAPDYRFLSLVVINDVVDTTTPGVTRYDPPMCLSLLTTHVPQARDGQRVALSGLSMSSQIADSANRAQAAVGGMMPMATPEHSAVAAAAGGTPISLAESQVIRTELPTSGAPEPAVAATQLGAVPQESPAGLPTDILALTGEKFTLMDAVVAQPRFVESGTISATATTGTVLFTLIHGTKLHADVKNYINSHKWVAGSQDFSITFYGNASVNGAVIISILPFNITNPTLDDMYKYFHKEIALQGLCGETFTVHDTRQDRFYRSSTEFLGGIGQDNRQRVVAMVLSPITTFTGDATNAVQYKIWTKMNANFMVNNYIGWASGATNLSYRVPMTSLLPGESTGIFANTDGNYLVNDPWYQYLHLGAERDGILDRTGTKLPWTFGPGKTRPGVLHVSTASEGLNAAMVCTIIMAGDIPVEGDTGIENLNFIEFLQQESWLRADAMKAFNSLPNCPQYYTVDDDIPCSMDADVPFDIAPRCKIVRFAGDKSSGVMIYCLSGKLDASVGSVYPPIGGDNFYIEQMDNVVSLSKGGLTNAPTDWTAVRFNKSPGLSPASYDELPLCVTTKWERSIIDGLLVIARSVLPDTDESTNAYTFTVERSGVGIGQVAIICLTERAYMYCRGLPPFGYTPANTWTFSQPSTINLRTASNILPLDIPYYKEKKTLMERAIRSAVVRLDAGRRQCAPVFPMDTGVLQGAAASSIGGGVLAGFGQGLQTHANQEYGREMQSNAFNYGFNLTDKNFNNTLVGKSIDQANAIQRQQNELTQQRYLQEKEYALKNRYSQNARRGQMLGQELQARAGTNTFHDNMNSKGKWPVPKGTPSSNPFLNAMNSNKGDTNPFRNGLSQTISAPTLPKPSQIPRPVPKAAAAPGVAVLEGNANKLASTA